MKKPLCRSAHVRTLVEAERRISAVASTERLDSFNTIIRANWDLERFLSNPVLLFVHNDCVLPVGRCENVRVEGRELLFDAVFDDVTDLDKQVWEKYRRGTMRGFSVRFNPLEQRTIKEGDRDVVEYQRSELLEISCTPLPSNPEALRRSAGREDNKRTMKRSELMKALKAVAEGDGSDDEKKSALAMYEAMGGDEGLQKALDAEGAEGGEDRAQGEEDGKEEQPPPSDRSAGRAEGKPATPYEDPARGAGKRSAGRTPSPLEQAFASLASRLDKIEKRTAGQEIDDVLKGRPDLAPSVVTEMRKLGDPALVRRLVAAMPKAEMRGAGKTATATRGAGETGENKKEPSEVERKIDRVLGIMSKSTGIGFGAPDPEAGVRRLSTMTPSQARANAAGKVA